MRKRPLAGLLACFISLVSASAPAVSTNSTWFARVWQSEEGLPNNNVGGIAQTPDGYLWVATPVGLVRFDGVRFEQIPTTNFISAPDRGVMSLLRSRAGGLWLQTDRGAVVHLNSRAPRVFTPTNGLPDLQAELMVESDDGTLWITYLGGAMCALKDGKATVLGADQGLPWDGYVSVARDNRGRIWAARAGAVGIFRDGHFQTQVQLEKSAIRLAAASGGGVWICSATGLFHFDQGGNLKRVAEFPTGRFPADPTVVLEDSNGGVWVGTAYAGLFRCDGSRFESIAASYREIVCLLEDDEGNVWVGTRGGGLNRLRQRAVRLESVEAGLPVEAVQSACEDSSGTLWAATANGLLMRRVGDRWTPGSTDPDWPGSVPTCVAADRNGGVWIGTRSRRLVRWHEGRFQHWARNQGLEANPVRSILVSTRGDVWMAGQNNVVQRYRDGSFDSFTIPEEKRIIRAMVEDAAGDIWFGTSRGYLFRAKGDKLTDETATTGETPRSIRCLAATSDGSLWIGYAGAGVGRLKNGKFAEIGMVHGLHDNFISQIVPDEQGWLWFGADHGIFKVRQQELEAVAEGQASRVRSIHYGRGEGLPNLQVDMGFSPGVVRGRNGRIWIPTRHGLAVVDPNKLGENWKAPPVVLKRAAVDDQTVAVYGGIVPVHGMIDLQREGKRLRLEPGHRKLDFEFTALSLAEADNVRFQYRLDGVDGTWIDGSQRSVTYSRLPAGDYTFRVKACNSSDVWNEKGATLAFTVVPFVWQTWWFRVLAVILFSSCVIVTVRYVSFRHLRSRVRVLEQQAALDKERGRIARDLHDDLGSRLTKIVLLSDLLVDSSPEPGKADGNAQQIATTARQVIKALDETVWAVNPRNDTLPHLINYIGQFAVEFLRTAGIRCRVDLPDRAPARAVSAEVRHNLFLAVKEALNNVVRHADAKEVCLRVVATEESLTLTLEDDGKGFGNPAVESDGADGLRNMRQRIEEIGGRFQLESKPGAGTKISFLYSWSVE